VPPEQGGVRSRAPAAEHGVPPGQLQVQGRDAPQVRAVGGAHGPVPRQEVCRSSVHPPLLLAFLPFLPNHFMSSSSQSLPIPGPCICIGISPSFLCRCASHYSFMAVTSGLCRCTAGTSTWACSTPRRKPPGKIIGPHCVLAWRRFSEPRYPLGRETD
jgi:hypothetical protein